MTQLKSQRVVYFNGNFVLEADARISIFDSALATGEVCVEITRTFNQRLFRLQDHLERLYASLRELQIDPGMTIDEMTLTTHRTLEQNLPTETSDVDWQIIHYISRGITDSFGIFDLYDHRPTVIITCFPLLGRIGRMIEKYETGADLVIPEQHVIPPDVLSPQIRSRGRLDYVLARIQAAQIRKGATGILTDSEGYIIEGTGSTLFMVYNERVHTTPAQQVVNGITRSVVIDLCRKLCIPVEERKISRVDAFNADEMFITSTIIGIIHARSFEGKPIKNSMCGPVTTKIRNAFITEIGLDFIEQARLYSKRLKERE